MTISAETERNLRLCVTVGVAVATAFSVWVLLNHVVGGSRAVERSGATVPAVIMAYYATGLFGGAVVGLLLPLARKPGGTIAVGAIAGSIAFISVQMAMKGAIWTWDRGTIVQTALLGIVFGSICAPLIARNVRR